MITEFHVEVVRIGPVTKHPNADSLSLTMVRGGYPCILRTGDFQEGSLAVYVPVDAVVPDAPRWEFLKGNRRIKAKRLRGIFSMGLLTAADPTWAEGRDVADALRIVKYELPEEALDADSEPDPGLVPVYGVEAFRRYPNAIAVGEEVVVTEKLDGKNGRFVHDGTRLWCGSHTTMRKETDTSKWWTAAWITNLHEKLSTIPGTALYGEVHIVGKNRLKLRFFDALDTKTRTWLDDADFQALCQRLELQTVPVLYRGPWQESLRELAEGKSTIDPTRVREGIVIRPVHERYDITGCGRVILKLHGEGFLTK